MCVIYIEGIKEGRKEGSECTATFLISVNGERCFLYLESAVIIMHCCILTEKLCCIQMVQLHCLPAGANWTMPNLP